MSPNVVSSPSIRRRAVSRRDPHARPRAPLSTPARRSEQVREGRALAGYLDAEGRPRELIALPGHNGSVLVLDRDAATLCDRLLVAHLAADEPPENAVLVSRHYVDDSHGHWCRRVRPEDLVVAPFGQSEHEIPSDLDASIRVVEDSAGNAYRLQPLAGKRANAQLRWCRRSRDGADDRWEQIPLRDVVAALENYEPVRTLTECAIRRHRDDPRITLTRLCSEFDRLCVSPVVLNRGLREAVLGAIDRHGTSMSEIALRCGIVKRDRRGNASGETSWLARRIGLMPEGGETAITPWIHTDVLATIARQGLGVSPRDVELQ